MTVFVVVWVGWNTLAPDDLRFDDYPFIFLTLILSLQASYAAPLILLAQNRQEARDRVIAEQDRQANARAHADMEFLAREVASLRMAVGEVATRDFLRSELRTLRDDLTEADEDEARHPRLSARMPRPVQAPTTLGSTMSAPHHRPLTDAPSRPSTTPRSSARSPTSAWSSTVEVDDAGKVTRHGAAHRLRLPDEGHHRPRRHRRASPRSRASPGRARRSA